MSRRDTLGWGVSMKKPPGPIGHRYVEGYGNRWELCEVVEVNAGLGSYSWEVLACAVSRELLEPALLVPVRG
jgi:hypothetical protein